MVAVVLNPEIFHFLSLDIYRHLLSSEGARGVYNFPNPFDGVSQAGEQDREKGGNKKDGNKCFWDVRVWTKGLFLVI